jgi:RNA polymerase sigma-70 factor (ECF subfamily)
MELRDCLLCSRPRALECSGESGRGNEPPMMLESPSIQAGQRACSPSDADLLRSAGSGEPRAWILIWQRYAGLVERYLRRRARVDVVDDLVQETFLVLYVSLHRIEQPAALRAFLLGTAARVLCASRRSSERRARHISLTASGTLPEPPANEHGTELEVASALSRVPVPYRDAFVLRHLSGLDVSEVASALEISPSSARRWIAHARRRVRRSMTVT